MDKLILELIWLVYKRKEHVQQLETLIDILEKAGYTDEVRVARTTHNSIYDYRLYTLDYKNPEHHIDKFMDSEDAYYGKAHCIKTELIP